MFMCPDDGGVASDYIGSNHEKYWKGPSVHFSTSSGDFPLRLCVSVPVLCLWLSFCLFLCFSLSLRHFYLLISKTVALAWVSKDVGRENRESYEVQHEDMFLL